MATQYAREYDEILNDILTDYLGLDEPPADVSKGSMPFIMASVVAFVSWGLRQLMDFITRQIVPGPEMDTEFLNKWAGYYDIIRTSDDTDATLLTKVLNRVRMPPAGGNTNDYRNWALDQSNSFITNTSVSPEVTYYNEFATVVDIPFGPGTVGVYTIPDDEAIIFDPPFSIVGANTGITAFKLIDAGATFDTAPDKVEIGFKVVDTDSNTTAIVTAVDSDTQLSLDKDIFAATPINYSILSLEEQLREATFTYIETTRPLGILNTTVVSAKPSVLNIVMDVIAGPSYDNQTTILLVTEYRDNLGPGESFFSSQAECIALANGAQSANVTTPAAEETPIADAFFHRGGSVITNII